VQQADEPAAADVQHPDTCGLASGFGVQHAELPSGAGVQQSDVGFSMTGEQHPL
jgi:hypothetical protein